MPGPQRSSDPFGGPDARGHGRIVVHWSNQFAKEETSDSSQLTVPESPSETDVLKCPQCGYELQGLGTRRCPECGTRFVIAGIEGGGDPRANSYITLCVVALLLFGLPGIIPIIYSVRTLTANSRHDYAAARRHSKTTVIWLVVGFVVGAALLLWLIAL